MPETTTATTDLPNPPGGHTAYGITVYEIGDEGEWMVAFGHHDERRFLAACNHYAREVVKLDGPFDDPKVSFEDAVGMLSWRLARYNPEPGDSYEWSLHWTDLGKNNIGTPVTVLERW